MIWKKFCSLRDLERIADYKFVIWRSVRCQERALIVHAAQRTAPPKTNAIFFGHQLVGIGRTPHRITLTVRSLIGSMINFPTPAMSKKLARWNEYLLECAAMLAAMKKFALVMMMLALPLQGLAAVFISVCQNDPTQGSSAVKSDHQHADQRDHDAPAPDHDHPLAANDIGSDHCSTGSAVAVPMAATKLPATPNSGHSLFLATSFSGHIPEQPQRPPRAVLL